MVVRLFVVVILIVAVTLTAQLAMAQDAGRGAAAYRSFPASCADCHNSDPKKDPYAGAASGGVRSGAGRPDLIAGAITSPGAYTGGKSDMYDLLYPLYIQNTATWDAMLADIAAYLGDVFATGSPVPPPIQPGTLSLPPAQGFGTAALATGVTRALVLTNVGGSTLTVTSVASSHPAEFAIASSTCNGSVAPSLACQINVVFSPSVAGARSASITIVSSGVGSPQAIALSGTGTAAAATTVAAQEFHHAAFDHYFITTIADEIAKLSNGTFAGWSPTGRSINVYPASSAPAGSASVCRFFSSAFAPKSSHFYTPAASECAAVKGNADWSFEGEVFNVPPAAVDGSCAPGTTAVYRLYNNGQGAAPNHRYTTDAAIRAQMIAQGWLPEGNGTLGIVMCAPL